MSDNKKESKPTIWNGFINILLIIMLITIIISVIILPIIAYCYTFNNKSDEPYIVQNIVRQYNMAKNYNIYQYNRTILDIKNSDKKVVDVKNFNNNIKTLSKDDNITMFNNFCDTQYDNNSYDCKKRIRPFIDYVDSFNKSLASMSEGYSTRLKKVSVIKENNKSVDYKSLMVKTDDSDKNNIKAFKQTFMKEYSAYIATIKPVSHFMTIPLIFLVAMLTLDFALVNWAHLFDGKIRKFMMFKMA